MIELVLILTFAFIFCFMYFQVVTGNVRPTCMSGVCATYERLEKQGYVIEYKNFKYKIVDSPL